MLRNYPWLLGYLLQKLKHDEWRLWQRSNDGGIPETDDIIVAVKESLELARKCCEWGPLKGRLPEIDRALEFKKTPAGIVVVSPLQATISHLLYGILDDLRAQKFLYVAGPNIGYYEAAEPFGALVSQKFSRAAFDISEAGKALALGRYTATVFHLMRVMEAAVQRLGKRFTGPIDVRNETWYQIMIHVNKGIEKMPVSTPALKGRKAKFATAASRLDNVHIAWRNEVMHPKATYTPEEAREVWASVEAFMRHLAEIF